MIFGMGWGVSTLLYSLFQALAPSNAIIRRIHTRDRIKWGPAVGLAGVVVYGTVMVLAVRSVQVGGPGWVNLAVLPAFWNTTKFAMLIPASTVRLLRVRRQEKVLVHAGRHAGYSALAEANGAAASLSAEG